MILSQIVAASQNGIIGNQGKLPWHIPEDLKWFHSKTRGHIIIMGRKTFESLPAPLPDRLNIVVTRNRDYSKPGILVTPNFDSAVELARQYVDQYGEEVFIGGGGEIYRETLKTCDRLYLTLIHKNYEGDAFFPVKELDHFETIERVDREKPVPFSILTMENKLRRAKRSL